MDALTAAAASGMRSRMESLDLLANNLANASSPGFKADQEFYNLYISADSTNSPAGSDLASQPVVDRHWTDFSQGSFTPTDNPLDLAIGGKGFFAVNSPAGTLYTRDGSFRLSTQGELETKDGFKLRDQKGQPIKVDASKPVEITADGSVRQDGQDVAKLDLVDFEDVHALSKHGRNYFQLSSSQPQPKPASQADLQQGKIENANFQPAESAVRLVTVLRQFETLQKAMSAGAEMNRKAVDEVARVN